jgi:hypothetical protein
MFVRTRSCLERVLCESPVAVGLQKKRAAIRQGAESSRRLSAALGIEELTLDTQRAGNYFGAAASAGFADLPFNSITITSNA